jgi:hypothetical protein
MTGRSTSPNHVSKTPKLTADVVQAVDDYRRALVAEAEAGRARRRALVGEPTHARTRASDALQRANTARAAALVILDEVLLGEEG